MNVEFEIGPKAAYKADKHREVNKFLRKHPDLQSKWSTIQDVILRSPKLGPHIDHLKDPWHCSYRWDEGAYRIKYDVLDDVNVIHFYDAGLRGDVYKRQRGAQRR